jgi:hypothetical protein
VDDHEARMDAGNTFMGVMDMLDTETMQVIDGLRYELDKTSDYLRQRGLTDGMIAALLAGVAINSAVN